MSINALMNDLNHLEKIMKDNTDISTFSGLVKRIQNILGDTDRPEFLFIRNRLNIILGKIAEIKFNKVMDIVETGLSKETSNEDLFKLSAPLEEASKVVKDITDLNKGGVHIDRYNTARDEFVERFEKTVVGIFKDSFNKAAEEALHEYKK